MGTLNALLNIGKEPNKKPIPGPLQKDIEDYLNMFNALKNAIELKNNGFGGKGVDTGPIAQYYPDTLSDLVAKMQGVAPEHQADRALLQQALKKILLPVRHSVTGSQFGQQETKEYESLLPKMGDNDNVFLNKAFQVGVDGANEFDNLINQLKQSGYEPTPFNKNAFIENLKKQVWKK